MRVGMHAYAVVIITQFLFVDFRSEQFRAKIKEPTRNIIVEVHANTSRLQGFERLRRNLGRVHIKNHLSSAKKVTELYWMWSGSSIGQLQKIARRGGNREELRFECRQYKFS